MAREKSLGVLEEAPRTNKQWRMTLQFVHLSTWRQTFLLCCQSSAQWKVRVPDVFEGRPLNTFTYCTEYTLYIFAENTYCTEYT